MKYDYFQQNIWICTLTAYLNMYSLFSKALAYKALLNEQEKSGKLICSSIIALVGYFSPFTVSGSVKPENTFKRFKGEA